MDVCLGGTDMLGILVPIWRSHSAPFSVGPEPPSTETIYSGFDSQQVNCTFLSAGHNPARPI